MISELQVAGGTSARAIAAALNARGIPTASGEGTWQAVQVQRALARIGAKGRTTASHGAPATPGNDDRANPEGFPPKSAPRACTAGLQVRLVGSSSRGLRDRWD